MAKTFERVTFAFHISNDNVSILGGFLPTDKHHISAIDPRANHGVARSIQDVHLIIAYKTGGEIHVSFQTRFNVSRNTAGNGTDNADRTGFVTLAGSDEGSYDVLAVVLDPTFLVHCYQIIKDGSALQGSVFGDLAAGRILVVL